MKLGSEFLGFKHIAVHTVNIASVLDEPEPCSVVPWEMEKEREHATEKGEPEALKAIMHQPGLR